MAPADFRNNHVCNGLTDLYVLALAVVGNSLFAVAASHGMYVSTNDGSSWKAVNGGIMGENWVNALAVSGTNVFAGTESGIFLFDNTSSYWNRLGLSLLIKGGLTAFGVSGTNLFAGTGRGGLFLSADSGKTWKEVNTGFAYTGVGRLAVCGVDLFAVMGWGGLWRRPLSDMITSVEQHPTTASTDCGRTHTRRRSVLSL